MSYKLLIPILLFAFTYLAFCWFDILSSSKTRHFSKGIWLLICTLSLPLGGVAYFIYGRGNGEQTDD